MEGKNLWKKFIPGSEKKESAAPEVEITAEDMERDIKLLEERLNSPEDMDEDLALQALERLLDLAEKNPDVKLKLENYLNEYKEGEETEMEERLIKNDSIYKKIEEGLKKQRLGKFYYDKDNPRRELGT